MRLEDGWKFLPLCFYNNFSSLDSLSFLSLVFPQNKKSVKKIESVAAFVMYTDVMFRLISASGKSDIGPNYNFELKGCKYPHHTALQSKIYTCVQFLRLPVLHGDVYCTVS